MAGLRQHGNNEIFVRADLENTFDACLKAAGTIGRVIQSNSVLGSISIRTPMRLFPPANPVNFKISVIPKDDGCMIVCNGDSVDGLVGFGSVSKAIDAFYEALGTYLR